MVCIHALGSNSSGQLATGNLDDAHYLTQTKFSQPAIDCHECRLWHVQGGGNHAFAWTDSGCLFASGTNKDGELALSDRSLTPLLWTRVEFPGSRVAKIACGWNHTLLLNDLGQVHSAGSASFGQLGVSLSSDMRAGSAGWVQVGAAKDISSRFVDIACGMRHSLALADDGRVYGCGANRHAQLGAVPDKQRPNVHEMVLVSKGLPPIAMIACGRSHSVLLAQDRVTVFVAGQDKYGQCGPSSPQCVAGTWRSFQLPSPALKLCSGWESAAVLLEAPDDQAGRGNVVMWGRADHGQLAVECNGSAFSKDLVRIPLDAQDIACGSNHTVAAASDGAVYAWGWNEHGNAGDPSLKDVYAPLRISSANSSGTAAIGCGYGNSYLVSDNERLSER